MLIWMIAIGLISSGSGPATPAYVLELAGRPIGEFAGLEVGDAVELQAELRDGWIAAAALRDWRDSSRTAEPLEPGVGRQEATECERRTLTLRQELGVGVRRRTRSLVLLDACPVAWTIRDVDETEERVTLEAITFVTREIAAELEPHR